MSVETSRRIIGFIEDASNFLRNWFIYILLIALVLAVSGWVGGMTFNYWQNSNFDYRFRYNIEEVLYKKGWKSLLNHSENYEYYKDYYEKFYAEYRTQYEALPEPQRSQYLTKLDETIEQYIAQSATPLPQGYLMKLLISTLGPLGFFGLIIFFMRAPIADFRPFDKGESLHGDAKWAGEKDIKSAGLRSKTGLLMGKDNRGFLVAPGYQHALLFAPTGSGKGVGFAIPNLLFWDESCFVHDIKLENFEITSGFRREVLKQDVFLWAPADPDGRTHCYNPLDWISKKPGQMVDDVQKIANLILPEQEFWNNEARSLFVGVTLYLLAVPDKVKSFGEVVRTLRSDDVVYNLAVVLDTLGKKIHPVSYMNIAAFLQKADKERSGVVSTLNSGLELWANPLIDTATASSDFNVQEMKKRRTTVFVGLTPDNIQRLQPLLQVFYQQATEFLVRKIPDKKEEPYGVLFMMDEFPTLGEMKQFHAGIAYFRGYNVRLFLIVQDTQQLKGIYEEHGMNTFLSNSTYRITFAANNVETANLISQLIGNKTVKQKSINKPKYLDLNPATRTIHESEIQRALLLPQEVIGLARDEQIILIESTPPIKTKKIFYYNESFFKRRLLDQIEIPTQEPFDPRIIEEEKKKKREAERKKREEERKKKEANKKPAPPPPPLPDFPDIPDMPEAQKKTDEKKLPPPPPPPSAAPSAPPPPPPAATTTATPPAPQAANTSNESAEKTVDNKDVTPDKSPSHNAEIETAAPASFKPQAYPTGETVKPVTDNTAPKSEAAPQPEVKPAAPPPLPEPIKTPDSEDANNSQDNESSSNPVPNAEVESEQEKAPEKAEPEDFLKAAEKAGVPKLDDLPIFPEISDFPDAPKDDEPKDS